VNLDDIQCFCLSLPHATETVQWGSDLVFKVGGKMFAVAPTEVAPVQLSFKCSPENFANLCERADIIPAPYLARAQWVAMETLTALGDAELGELLAESHRLVWEKLPKRVRDELAASTIRKSNSKSPSAPSRSSAKRVHKRKRLGA